MIPNSTENRTTVKAAPESCIEAITIVIADDHPVVREGLVAIFKSQKDIKVVGEATHGEEAVELCNRILPDVLLLDLRMPRKDGLQAIAELSMLRVGRPRVIVMTTYESEEDIRGALKALLLVNEQLEAELQQLYAAVALGGPFERGTNALH